MPKIQYCFNRSEELRFLSHLDQQRLFQRAFRRAGFNLEYSQGFNPHPKMSFALAMSVGLTSDCEFGEVSISDDLSLEDFLERLNKVLPKGLKVREAFYPAEGSSSLSADIKESQYQIEIESQSEIPLDNIKKILSDYLALKEILVEKRNKKGKMVEKNIRSFIHSITMINEKCTGKTFCFELDLIYIDQQCVKPDLIFKSMNDIFDTQWIIDPGLMVHRLKLQL